MSRRVYVITVTGELDEVLGEQFDDVEMTSEHGVRNGEQTKASARVNALRIDAARSQGLAQGHTQVDIAMFFPVDQRHRHR